MLAWMHAFLPLLNYNWFIFLQLHKTGTHCICMEECVGGCLLVHVLCGHKNKERRAKRCSGKSATLRIVIVLYAMVTGSPLPFWYSAEWCSQLMMSRWIPPRSLQLIHPEKTVLLIKTCEGVKLEHRPCSQYAQINVTSSILSEIHKLTPEKYKLDMSLLTFNQ